MNNCGWIRNGGKCILEQENKKYKEAIDRIEKYIEKETRIYGLSMSIELRTHFDNILGILKAEKRIIENCWAKEEKRFYYLVNEYLRK